MYIEEQIKQLNTRLTAAEAEIVQNKLLIDSLTETIHKLLKVDMGLTENLSSIVSLLNPTSSNVPHV